MPIFRTLHTGGLIPGAGVIARGHDVSWMNSMLSDVSLRQIALHLRGTVSKTMGSASRLHRNAFGSAARSAVCDPSRTAGRNKLVQILGWNVETRDEQPLGGAGMRRRLAQLPCERRNK